MYNYTWIAGIMEKIRLILVARREVCREGVAMLLNQGPDIEVVWKCSGGVECIEKTLELKPDVVLMDTEISEGDCIQAIQAISNLVSQSRVLVFTHPEQDHLLLSALKAGARAYISKDVRLQDLVGAIVRVSAGEVIVSPPMAERLMEEFALLGDRKDGKRWKTDAHISQREAEVLGLVAKGKTNKEIAEALFINVSTVKTHLGRILEKLQVRNRREAAVLWIERR